MKRHVSLVVLLAVAAGYLVAVNDQWATKSDSALYVGLGRALAEGRGMIFNGQAQWGAPPVVPLVLAGCRLLVGPHYWLPNLLMSVAGLGVVILAWATARQAATVLPRPWRDGVALGTLVIVGTSARLFIDSTILMTDVPCTLFLLAGVYALLRWRDRPAMAYPALAAAMLVATLTRIPALVFAVGLGAAAAMDAWRRPRRWRALGLLAASGAAAGLLFLWWAVAVRSRTDPGSADYLAAEYLGLFNLLSAEKWVLIGRALVRLPDAVTSSIVYQKLSWFGLVPIGLILVGWWRLARRRQWALVAPAVAHLGLLVVLGIVASRYLLPIMPLLALAMLVGLLEVTTPLRRRLARAAHRMARRAKADGHAGPGRRLVRLGRRIAIVAVPAAVVLCASISLPKIGREVYWMRHPDFYRVFDGGRWRSFQALADHLRRRADPATDRCLAPVGSVVHYWSGVVCRSTIHWQGKRHLHLADLPPEDFARFAAASPFTFLAVPMDKGAWSTQTAAAMGTTGAFEPDVTRVGTFALFRRAPSRRAKAAGRLSPRPKRPASAVGGHGLCRTRYPTRYAIDTTTVEKFCVNVLHVSRSRPSP